MAVIKFFVTDPIEQRLALDVLARVDDHHTVDFMHVPKDFEYTPEHGGDLACFVGMDKAPLKHSLEAYGVPWVFFGPSYRHRGEDGYYRVAVCDIHPLHWLSQTRIVRDEKLPGYVRWKNRWKNRDRPELHILICGAGAAFHKFMGLPDPEVWLQDLVEQIKLYTDRKIVFRPKPGHEFSVNGVQMSSMGSLMEDMEKAQCMVVHSANTCLDAFDYGLPCVVTGHGVSKSVSLSMPNMELLPRLLKSDWLDFYHKIRMCDWDVYSFAGGLAGHLNLMQQLRMHSRTQHLF